MHFVKLFYQNSSYSYNGCSSLELCILGRFLSSDVGKLRTDTYKKIGLDKECTGGSGNITNIEKEGNYLFISDLYSEEKIPTELKISCEQYVKLLDDWKEKVCDKHPKHVIIKHENNEFIIETSDQEFLV